MLNRRAMLATTAAATAIAAAAPARAADSPNPKLAAMFDSFVQENLDLSPISVSALGMDTGKRAYQKALVDEGSEAAIDKNKALNSSQLARLSAFDRASLRGDDLVSYDVVMYGLKTGDVANKRFAYGQGGAGAPYILSQLTGSYQQSPSFLDNQHTIETKADADAYLSRIEGFARLMDQEIDDQRHDMAMGVFAPDFALDKALGQMNDLRAPAPEAASITQSLVTRAKAKNIPGDWQGQATKSDGRQILSRAGSPDRAGEGDARQGHP